VTLVTVAVSRIVSLLALTVTLMWMRPASPGLSVPRRHVTVAPRVPALGVEHCPLVAEALRKVAPAGRWSATAACHASDGPASVILMV
jgi:hypothetical protein